MIPAEGDDLDTLIDLLLSSPVSTQREKGEMIFPALETVHDDTTALWSHFKPSMLIPDSFYLTWQPRGARAPSISTTSETRSATLENMTPENSNSMPMLVPVAEGVQGRHAETHAWRGVEVGDPMEGLSMVQTHNPSLTTSPSTPRGLISSATTKNSPRRGGPQGGGAQFTSISTPRDPSFS